MELAYDTHLLARLLLTIPIAGYGFLAPKNDFNTTHATNPLWTPHARFHVVWQMLSYSGIGLIALGLIWIRGPLEVERLYLATALGGVVLGAFFLTALARSMFGGSFHDVNGYQPFKPPFGPDHWRWDLNLTAFTAFAIIQILGWALI